MTKSEAIEQAGQLNTIITDYIGTIIYKVFAVWNSQFEKSYETVLIPTKYETEFEAGDVSEQFAFKRVSVKTLLLEYTTADSWVSSFDVQVLNDEELNNYLNPKP
jgi:hypothetical protein